MTNEEWRLDHYGRVRELEGVVGLICAIYAWRECCMREGMRDALGVERDRRLHGAFMARGWKRLAKAYREIWRVRRHANPVIIPPT